MKKYSFYVTQKDIDRGIGESKAHCPVALAVNRRLGLLDSDGVQVSCQGIITWDGFEDRVVGNEAVADFVRAFDSGNVAVKPFRFTVEG